jgi:uncharacterized membrane protein
MSSLDAHFARHLLLLAAVVLAVAAAVAAMPAGADTPPAAAGSTIHGFVFEDGGRQSRLSFGRLDSGFIDLLRPHARTRRPAPTPTTANTLLRNGRFTALEDVPGAAITGYTGANDRGQIVGSYLDEGLISAHGFLRERDGTIRTIDVPGAQVTLLYDINNRGQIVGTYVEEGLTPDPNSPAPPGFQHAFLWEKGKVTIVDPPDTVYAPNAYAINDRGQIVGVRADAQLLQTGYLRNPNRRYTDLDPPGAAENKALGINDRGQVVGGYLDDGAEPGPDGQVPPGTVHGYVWDDGRYTRLDVPGARGTGAFRIDDKARVVGEYKAADGSIHGFLREKGRYATVDGPDRTIDSIVVDITNRGELLIQAPRFNGVVGIVA